MNSPNRHMRYRRSIYRKKRIKIIAVSAVCAVAVIALLFLVIGNMLGNKVEENVESRSSRETQAQAQTRTPYRSVNAFPVALSDDDSSLSSRLGRTAANGYSDICFELDSADGALLYSSDVAIKLGRQSSGRDLWKLTDAMKLAEENGLYSVGITHVSDFSDDNDLLRSAALGYHSALIAEALRSGVDEVLIFATNTPAERYGELIELAAEVKRLCPDGVIGISLPVSVFADSQSSTLIDSLRNAFDYLAADLTHCVDGEISAAEQVSNELGQMLYYLLRYNVRALVAYSDNADTISQIRAAVNSSGSENIQIMPPQVQ